MRSSYGFQKFLQAIYVVFERAGIVTSHDGGAVSACAARRVCDASHRSRARSAARAWRAARILIDKNRLFCIARRWRSLIVRFLHASRARIATRESLRSSTKNRIEKIFGFFFDAIVCAAFLHAEARVSASCIARILSRAMRSHPGL